MPAVETKPRPAPQGPSPGKPPAGDTHFPTYGSWSACQANMNPADKDRMAAYFAAHDFLVRGGRNGETEARERAAHFLVAPGTTPNTVVRVSLEWMRDHWDPNPFTVTWYPLGALIPASLFEFKQKSPQCESAARLFLCPGEVDPQSESVIGKYPVEFLNQLDIRLSGSILSAHRFDMATGDAYFYFDKEVEVQQAGAEFYADEKFLFLDPSKFGAISGSPGYNVRDLLRTSQSVTLYTVSSPADGLIKSQFEALCARLKLTPVPDASADGQAAIPPAGQGSLKRLRLCIVSKTAEVGEDIPRIGVLPDNEVPAPSVDGVRSPNRRKRHATAATRNGS